MQQLKYATIIPELEALFPRLMQDEELRKLSDDLPGIYLTFLIPYVKENWEDQETRIRLALLLDKMAASQEALGATFYDFALDLYLSCKEDGLPIESFLETLKPLTRREVAYCVDYWLRSNGRPGLI